MARKANFCVLGACIALAACGGGGSGGSGGTTGPGGPGFTPPFDLPTGDNVPMLSVTPDGISAVQATIRFDADGSFTLTLPDSTTVTLTEADEPFFSGTNPFLETSFDAFVVDGTTVTVNLGEDAAGQDLFQIVEVVEHVPPDSSKWIATLVFGDDTETLPGGTANFTGGFQAGTFDATGASTGLYQGTSAIDVNFTSGDVTVVLDAAGPFNQFTGTGTISSGTSRYAGTIATTGGATAFSGDFNGGLFGTGAEGTAGTFHATDPTGDPAGTRTMAGVFTGFRPSP